MEVFEDYLKVHNAIHCKCGRKIDRGDVRWNNPYTEAGTPFTVVDIVCQKCDTEIAHFSSWYPGADNFEDLIEFVFKDWE